MLVRRGFDHVEFEGVFQERGDFLKAFAADGAQGDFEACDSVLRALRAEEGVGAEDFDFGG